VWASLKHIEDILVTLMLTTRAVLIWINARRKNSALIFDLPKCPHLLLEWKNFLSANLVDEVFTTQVS
jgi:hypothetical protein